MKYLDEFRDPGLAETLVENIRRRSTRPVRIMEFCGTHTVSIFKHGIRQLLPPTIGMLSGPGCPVCVTGNADLDWAIALANEPEVIVTTFGDMLRVPGSRSSLEKAKAEGADVRMVYSTLDALQIAKDNPDRLIVFLGIGFETTAPTIAASVLQAQAEGVDNYYILSMHKLTPPATRAILDSGESSLDGIIGPGHVTTIIGARAWEFLPREYGLSCAIAGFEPLDILQSIHTLVDRIESEDPQVDNVYSRSVRPEGNKVALEHMYRVFEVCTTDWRGIGAVPASGLRLRERYRHFDARERFQVDPGPVVEPPGCLCGDVIRGVRTPPDCGLYRKVCTPHHPVGPCMVSSEGTCAAYYLYAGEQRS
ncbi:MAG: hydrogenase formation protein HypD [Anaerolineae bacterium]